MLITILIADVEKPRGKERKPRRKNCPQDDAPPYESDRSYASRGSRKRWLADFREKNSPPMKKFLIFNFSLYSLCIRALVAYLIFSQRLLNIKHLMSDLVLYLYIWSWKKCLCQLLLKIIIILSVWLFHNE